MPAPGILVLPTPDSAPAIETAPVEPRLAGVLEGLPTLPEFLFELSTLLEPTCVDLKKVAQAIRSDPSLVAQLLRIANTMPYATAVWRIEDAVRQAGPDRLRGLALTCGLVPPRGPEVSSFQVQSFWQHSMITAQLSKLLAQRTSYPESEKAYVAGLVHDIGVLARMFHSPEETESARETGVLLAAAWNYPTELIEGLECHHHPQDARIDPALAGLVAFADQFAESHGLGLGDGAAKVAATEDEKRLTAMLEAELPALLQSLDWKVIANY